MGPSLSPRTRAERESSREKNRLLGELDRDRFGVAAPFGHFHRHARAGRGCDPADMRDMFARPWPWGDHMRYRGLILGALVFACAASARADGYDGKWSVVGPASCPFRIELVVTGDKFTGTWGGAAASGTLQGAIAADGSFKFDLGRAVGTGQFKSNTLEFTLRDSRCGSVTASGSHVM